MSRILPVAVVMLMALAARGDAQQKIDYTYDSAGRLTTATYDDTLQTVYTYDESSNLVSIVTGPYTVSVEAGATPTTFALGPATPNPFTGSTSLRYRLPVAARVTLDVFDVSGRHVRRLVDVHQEAGEYTFEWDGASDEGLPVGSGVYFTRVQAGLYSGAQRLVRID